MARKGFVVREWRDSNGTGGAWAVRDDGAILRKRPYSRWMVYGRVKEGLSLDDLDRWAAENGLQPVRPRVTWEARQSHNLGVGHRWVRGQGYVPVERHNIRFR
jgi:hypothetical protein